MDVEAYEILPKSQTNKYTLCIPCIKKHGLTISYIYNMLNKLQIGNIYKIDIVPIQKQQKRFISNIDPSKSYDKYTVFIHYNNIYDTEHAQRIKTRLEKNKPIYVCDKFDIWKCLKYKKNKSKN